MSNVTDPGLPQAPEQKGLLQSIPWIWVAAAAGVYLLVKSNQKPKRTPRTRSNPRMPDELPIPYGSGRDYLELSNPVASMIGPRGERTRRVTMEMNPVSPCLMGPSWPLQNPSVNGLNISPGNSKMGYIWNWSMTPGPRPKGTCPGATQWCKQFCYAASGKSALESRATGDEFAGRWYRNQKESEKPDFAAKMIDALQRIESKEIKPTRIHGQQTSYSTIAGGRFGNRVLRIHVGGDFYSNRYVEDWIQIVDALPKWRFYAYTRSWARPDLIKSLMELKKRSNIVLRASTDPTSAPLPPGWLEAGVIRVHNRPSVICPALNPNVTGKRRYRGQVTYRAMEEITLDPGRQFPLGRGRKVFGEIYPVRAAHFEIPCSECGICFNDKHVNVAFPVHSVAVNKWPEHIATLEAKGWAREAEEAKRLYALAKARGAKNVGHENPTRLDGETLRIMRDYVRRQEHKRASGKLEIEMRTILLSFLRREPTDAEIRKVMDG